MDTKQVIVLRKDLNMRKGKMVAQGAHASMKVFFDRMSEVEEPPYGAGQSATFEIKVTSAMSEWMNGSFAKICVSVNSEQELLDVFNKARAAGIPCSLIQDAGRTEFGGVPTFTAVAVGPDTLAKIDPITGLLPLL